jgi:predicted nuclease of predicted toxin-antitoxin system
MRRLLDQGLPRGASAALSALGHDAIHTGELGMSSAPDIEILSYGKMDERVIVTLDSDFHALLAASGENKPSVLRIREEGLRAIPLAALINGIALRFGDALLEGCVMSYHEGKVRHRSLPLV